jgi:hypothetical protein
MHDPMTVAFEIKRPWPEPMRNGRRYWPPLVTIWHVDPERRGDDDSCDWWGQHRSLNAREKAIVEATWNLETLLDNAPHFPSSREHLAFQELKAALRVWQRRSRWRLPVRLHVWHWRIQIHPVQDFKRWAFSRCSKCGGRFRWGYAPVTTQWNGHGPRWFRSEEHTFHSDCGRPGNDHPAQAVHP